MSVCYATHPDAARSPSGGPAGAYRVFDLHDRPDLGPAWQAYVAAAPGATLFHELAWRDAVQAAFRHVPHYLLAVRGRETVGGVIPLFEVHSLLAGTILVSVPYAVYGGALADDADASAALLDAVQALARRIGARYADIRSIDPLWSQLPVVRRYATFRKELPGHPDGVLPAFPRKARAECRKARNRYGLRTRYDDDKLAVVWDLYSRTLRRLGSPNLPLRFFEALIEATPGAHLVSVVYDGSAAVAGLLSLVHRDTVMPYYNGYVPAAASTMGANNFLYASLMEEAVRRGLRRFDFGRTRVDNTGPFAFKRNQGFEPTPLQYQFWAPAGRPMPDLTPGNRRFQMAQWIWRRLPLPVTRPLGAWLSGSIPG